jgi:GAF domain/FHA domain
MPARLIVYFPERPTGRFLLEEGRTYVLGRDDGCEVVLADQRVSRRHARLRFEEGRWHLFHLGSKNGLTVGGSPWQEGPLPESAWISFGGLLTELDVLSEEAARREEERDLSRFQTSLQLQLQLDPAVGLEQLLKRTLDSFLGVSGAERGFILLVGEDGGLAVSVAAGLEAEELADPEFSGSIGALDRALAEGLPVTLADVSSDAELARRQSVLSSGIRALVCLPLRVLERTIGVIYGDSRKPGSAFTELDLDLLAALTSHAALALAVARLHEEVEDLGQALPAATTLSAETLLRPKASEKGP